MRFNRDGCARFIILGVMLFAPVGAFAVNTILDIWKILGNIFGAATPIVVAFATLGFFWGLGIYIFKAGDEKAKAEGKSMMVWGVVALFVMLSIFGIINVLQGTFGLQNNALTEPNAAAP